MINTDIRWDLVKNALYEISDDADALFELASNAGYSMTVSNAIEKIMLIKANCRGILKEIDWDDYFSRQESEEAE